MSDVQGSAPEHAGEERARLRVWISVGAGLIGAFMAVLNIQITNASLLDIEGGIGTGVDNGAWISTAYLIPMSFTLVLTKLPEAQRPAGLALFAITATFAPAIGPTIGGYLTENFG